MIVASIIALAAILCAIILRSNKKPFKSAEEKQIPEGVITPEESLVLDDKQKVALKKMMKNVNEILTRNIDGNTRSCDIRFDFADDFPKESIYEIERLYKLAGWITKIDKGYYSSFWQIKFSLPEHIELPKQLTGVRVDIADSQSDPNLSELGIDPLEEKFKELERKEKKK